MMTFLVIGDFVINAQLLDNVRLGKQRVEAMQIINVLIAKLKGLAPGAKMAWINHPAVKAWEGYIPALQYYTNCIINEFVRRGYTNNMELYVITEPIVYPWWTQWDRLHNSHRAMLLRKDPFFYPSKFTVPDEFKQYGYIWPHIITEANRDAPLADITTPIPEDLTGAVFCTYPLKSGKRKGESCNLLVRDKQLYCNRHRKCN